jgi:trimethylguanosine synthase
MRSVVLGGTRSSSHSHVRKVGALQSRPCASADAPSAVIAIDLDPVRLGCAAHNAALYGVADRITFVLADFTEWSRDYARRQTAGEIPTEDQVEVVFLSPPWGGIDYQQAGTDISDSPVASSLAARKSAGSTKEGKGKKSTPAPSYPLSALAPLPGDQLFSLARLITPHVAYYLPRNVDIDELGSLPAVSPRTDRAASEGPERVEIEEEWMGGRMKAVTAYYGDLATAAADRIESTA